MKNLITKIGVFFIAFHLISCSSDENNVPEDQSFFDLRVGNSWTYKRYYFEYNNPETYTFSGITDEVEIVENVVLNGINFSKVRHIQTSENSSDYVYFDYLRVNERGHLIAISEAALTNIESINEDSGTVYHPGNDTEYQNTVQTAYGSIHYHSAPETSMTVENNSYRVIPYLGLYSPFQEESPSKTTEDNYQEKIGLVKRVCHEVISNHSWEDRLVSYRISN